MLLTKGENRGGKKNQSCVFNVKCIILQIAAEIKTRSSVSPSALGGLKMNKRSHKCWEVLGSAGCPPSAILAAKLAK